MIKPIFTRVGEVLAVATKHCYAIVDALPGSRWGIVEPRNGVLLGEKGQRYEEPLEELDKQSFMEAHELEGMMIVGIARVDNIKIIFVEDAFVEREVLQLKAVRYADLSPGNRTSLTFKSAIFPVHRQEDDEASRDDLSGLPEAWIAEMDKVPAAGCDEEYEFVNCWSLCTNQYGVMKRRLVGDMYVPKEVFFLGVDKVWGANAALGLVVSVSRASLQSNRVFMRDIILPSGKRDRQAIMWIALSMGWLGACTPDDFDDSDEGNVLTVWPSDLVPWGESYAGQEVEQEEQQRREEAAAARQMAAKKAAAAARRAAKRTAGGSGSPKVKEGEVDEEEGKKKKHKGKPKAKK
ncbi:hypothetical protein HXX76_016181 [Chlamydomonas incerta]|uniref:Uncharacterized protein n=1 Tax=Chlamydomonas incerta TaxID=51695 RepID=A0A835SGW6_CHLIN|nr:hypothetical protein HXX76_016181 [Chlamydomonas incerta]|eukprot:KAG2422254.1 hypothetical protein HXX76_016181 [Chlamydomonas incerta]